MIQSTYANSQSAVSCVTPKARPSENSPSLAYTWPRQKLKRLCYNLIMSSSKDYKVWHQEKAALQNTKVRPGFYEREVWFTVVGENIGYEQDGRGERFLRPVVVIKKFNNEVLWALPLTTKEKTGKYYFTFTLGQAEKSTAILSGYKGRAFVKQPSTTLGCF